MVNKNKRFIRRKERVRNKIYLTSRKQFRLVVIKSNRHFGCQLIDVFNNKVLASSSTMQKSLKKENKSNCNATSSVAVAESLGVKAQELGISEVVFDRGAHKYHGVIKSFAEKARQYIKF